MKTKTAMKQHAERKLKQVNETAEWARARLDILDMRLGPGTGATNERSRLRKMLEVAK